MTIRASICTSVFNKAHLLPATLNSIFRQDVPFELEVIVVDDGSPDSQVHDVCLRYPVIYYRIERPPVFRNPCVGRNAAYKIARGNVIIAQSDEVIHVTPNAIEMLVKKLGERRFIIANVWCLSPEGDRYPGEFTGPKRLRPLFFLGSLRREDLYAVGGNDEDFCDTPGGEDEWFSRCLINGLGLEPDFRTDIVGEHQWHAHVDVPGAEHDAWRIVKRKTKRAQSGVLPWCSRGGAWRYVPQRSYREGIFTRIYESNDWKCDESVSGEGSSLVATQQIREHLPEILRQYDVKTMLDLPCGDYNWMREVDLPVDSYTGGDVVKAIIEQNAAKYGDDRHTFLELDLITSDLPRADLVLCRDCLGHLSYHDTFAALQNLKRSGSKYLLTTTFTRSNRKNLDIITGNWYPITLQHPPFHFLEPLLMINEDCKEGLEVGESFADKSLALWQIDTLPTQRKR